MLNGLFEAIVDWQKPGSFELRRGQLTQFLLSGGQLALIVLLLQANSPSWRIMCLVLMAACSLLAWTLALRRRRAITDSPVSLIASAAQGYVSLHGWGKPLEPPLRSQIFQVPCLWYRFETEQRSSDNKWHHIASGESELPFVLGDGSGECLIDHEGAEIVTTHVHKRSSGDYRSTEWTLRMGDEIYLLGNFRTRNHAVELDAGADVKALLEEWKKDREFLLERFDLDKNGEIDLREWDLVRRAARREVEKQHQQARERADTHVVECPPDGRLYLISNRDPAKLAQNYLLWMLFHLSVFFGSLIAIPLM